MFILIEYILTQLALTGPKSFRKTLFEAAKFNPMLITRHATTIVVLSFMYTTAKYSMSIL